MTAAESSWLPFRDPSRARRLRKVGGWLATVAVAIVICQLLGVDVTGWLSQLWDTLSAIAVGYLVAGHPTAPVPYRQILAAYASGVALNGFLPANIGTFVMLLMYVAIIPGAT